MRASVTEARAAVYVGVHMPKECVCERKDVHAYCSKMLAAQQKLTLSALAESWEGVDNARWSHGIVAMRGTGCHHWYCRERALMELQTVQHKWEFCSTSLSPKCARIKRLKHVLAKQYSLMTVVTIG